MKRTLAIAVTLAALLVGCTLALAKDDYTPVPEPAKLLGIPYDTFRKLYPDECSELKRMRVKGKDFVTGNGQLVDTCSVKHHGKELVPGLKIKRETLGWFSSPANTPVPWCKVFAVFVTVEGSMSGMDSVYGQPDPPTEFPSSDPMFGSVTYGGSGQSTTLNNVGESHTFITSWTRHYPNGWGLSIVATTNASETWGMMVQDTELGVNARPVVEQGVKFTMLPPPAKSTQSPANK